MRTVARRDDSTVHVTVIFQGVAPVGFTGGRGSQRLVAGPFGFASSKELREVATTAWCAVMQHPREVEVVSPFGEAASPAHTYTMYNCSWQPSTLLMATTYTAAEGYPKSK